jgi:hypothetical protein
MSRLSTPDARSLALGKALTGAWFPRQLAAVAVATPIALTPTIFLVRGRPVDFVVAPVVFLVSALGLQWLFLRGRLRAALEAFAWVGRSEWLRARDELGGSFPTSRRAARAWLARGEIPRQPAAVDLLVAAGEYTVARQLADQLPRDDAWRRFERESQRDWVEWVITGRNAIRHATLDAFRELRDPDERLRAEAVLALARARDRLAAGGDWKEPLERLREQLGPAADGILRRDWWRTQARMTAVVALGFAVVFAWPT